MNVIEIQKGRDIKIKGTAVKTIKEVPLPSTVAVQPQDFKGLRPRLLVKVNDDVKVGTPLLEDKMHSAVKIVSPASGKITAVNRGERRALLQIVIELDKKQDKEQGRQLSLEETKKISREEMISHLCEGGVWPCIRQRPFSNIADPTATPKAIFVQAMNTEPLAPDADFILNGQEKRFQIGLSILKQLTPGDVHLCCDAHAQSQALTSVSGVKIHKFSGYHPTGNVSTHIHYIDPVRKGDIVWYIRAEDVLKVAAVFLDGVFLAEKVVAVTGEGVTERLYQRTIAGAPLAHLLKGVSDKEPRYISGSVLSGTNVGPEGFVCFYDSQITVFPEGGAREFLGWMKPGFNKYTFSRTFASAFTKKENVSLNADLHGGKRAIVLNDVYDKYVSLNIMTYFLLRAVISGDLEEAEQLGILECDEEDFALCTFACPSKMDVGQIIRQGLDLIEKEG